MKIEEIIKANFKNEQHKAIVNIRYTNNWMLQKQNDIVYDFDLSMAQFNILRILRGAKCKLNVATLKERMVEKSPNTTRLLDKLIEKGLITRCRCEIDRRVLFIEINEEGLKILSELDEQGSVLFPFLDNITEKEATILSSLLDKIRG